jgi:hypothetical protein
VALTVAPLDPATKRATEPTEYFKVVPEATRVPVAPALAMVSESDTTSWDVGVSMIVWPVAAVIDVVASVAYWQNSTSLATVVVTDGAAGDAVVATNPVAEASTGADVFMPVMATKSVWYDPAAEAVNV